MDKQQPKKYSKPRRWSTDTLWGTGYKHEKVYCDCSKCLTASLAKKHGKAKKK